ncbi:MAG: NAD(P)H-hydrate epimerase [Elusimicrobiota bacterium]
MKEAIPEEYQGYPVVTPKMMQEIDRRAIEEYGIPSLELMESAGRAIADETIKYLKKHSTMPVEDTMVTVCCGRGNNGGDGLVVARYLKEAGYEVQVYIAPAKRDRPYPDEVHKNLGRANEVGVSVHQVSEELVELDVRLRSSAINIDALLGTGASGKPAGYTHRMVQRLMKAGKPIISVDVPTGLNPETGYHSGVVVTAVMTCALGLPKCGLLATAARRFVGELKILEIGFPEDLIRKVVDAAERMR